MIFNLEKLRKDFKSYRKKDVDISNRLNILIEYTKIELKYQGLTKREVKKVHIESFFLGMEINIRTIQRWKNAYKLKGVKGLKKKKAAGRKAVPVAGHIAKKITEMRKNYRWGAEVIVAHLKYDDNVIITKNRVERYLNNSGLRKKYPCTTKKKIKSNTKKKHNKIVKVEEAGKHTQIDVKHLPYVLPFGFMKCYVYNFIDHASNWSFKKAYESYGHRETEDFLKSLIKHCPFLIKRLQSDGGIEFTNKYVSKYYDTPLKHPLSDFCQKNLIRHVVIPPGEKELQGLVERSHRQDDQEFYIRAEVANITDFNISLLRYCNWRNESRRFKKLGWISPNVWLENNLIFRNSKDQSFHSLDPNDLESEKIISAA